MDVVREVVTSELKERITLGWLQRYLHSSPMYWKIVTSCFLQSFQNCEAENFFFNTQVEPEIQHTTMSFGMFLFFSTVFYIQLLK